MRRASLTRPAIALQSASIDTPENEPRSPISLNAIALVYILLSIAACLFVAADIFLIGRRQKMGVMGAVWPLTLLYWGPIGLPFYFGFGHAPRAAAQMQGHAHGHAHGHTSMDREPPMWQAVFKDAAHCGAGCALGDFAAEWIALSLGVALIGPRSSAGSP